MAAELISAGYGCFTEFELQQGLTPSTIAMVAEVFLMAGRMDFARWFLRMMGCTASPSLRSENEIRNVRGQALRRLFVESPLSTPSVHEVRSVLTTLSIQHCRKEHMLRVRGLGLGSMQPEHTCPSAGPAVPLTNLT